MQSSKAASLRSSGFYPLAAAFLVSCIAAIALASETEAPPSSQNDPTPFGRFVPEDAGFFVSVQRLDEVTQALSKAHADRILALLTGTDASQFPSFDPRTLIAAFSSSSARVDGEELESAGFGIAAPSWEALLDGVLFVQTPAEPAIQHWFPQGRAARISPTTRIVRLEDEIVACARDDVVALARDRGAGSMMRETLRLMAGRTSDAVLTAERFRELVQYLPAKPVALAYISKASNSSAMSRAPDPSVEDDAADAGELGDAPPSDSAEDVGVDEHIDPDAIGEETEAATLATEVEPTSLKDVLVGMYDRGGRLDFAMRGTRMSSVQREALSEAAVARVRSLPQSTVLAWAGTHDFDAVLRGEVEEFGGVLSRYARLFAGLRRREGTLNPVPPLGRKVIVALDRDPTAERQTPQAVAMLDSPDSRALAAEFGDAVDAFLDLIYSIDTVQEQDAPAIEVWMHGETPVSTVELNRYASASRFRGAALVRSMAPSWAAVGDWFIITTTKEEMIRVLEADAGAKPTLGEMANAKAVFEQGAKRNSLGFVQGSALAELLVEWLRHAEKGYPSILNRTTMAKSALSSGPRPAELGITLREPPSAGEVVVEDVAPGSSAHGQLYPEDRIMAIDGRVLSLALPNQDFQRRLAAGTSQNRTLRVLRGDEVVEVTLSTPPVAVNLPAIPLDAGAATRELALIVREIEFASFSELHTEPEHYSALVSVRFVSMPQPVPPPSQPVVETTPPDQAD